MRRIPQAPGPARHYAGLIIIALLVALTVAVLASRGTGQSDEALETSLTACTGCHGTDGRSTDPGTPILAGQNYDYLVNQLTRFADGAPNASIPNDSQISPIVRGLDSIRDRRSEIMARHMEMKDGATLHALARYFSKLPCVQAAPVDPSVARPPGTAWCDDCHSPAKAASMTNVPFLNGQHARYLEAQLLAFKQAAQPRDGSDERFHHFMSRSVRAMPDARLREIATYYEAQPCSTSRP